MTIIRALVSIPMDSGLPEDVSTNSLYFSCPLVDEATELADVHAALTVFYQAIDGLLSMNVNTPATVKYYNMGDPTPRVPLKTETIALTPGAGDPYPSEVALCLSFQGAKVSGVPQSRRRGRIYVGPLAQSAGGTGSAQDRPSAAALTTLGTAATNLATQAFGTGTPWHVYSSTNNSSVPVTDGWVDNAFDTQRRRGVSPTSRTTWT